MTSKVQFYYGTEAEYASIESKEENIFYYITDTNDLYFGSTKLSGLSDADRDSIIVELEGKLIPVLSTLTEVT